MSSALVYHFQYWNNVSHGRVQCVMGTRIVEQLLITPLSITNIYNFLLFHLFVALMWGYGLLVTMVPITAEQLFGQHASKSVALFLAAYGAYVLVPVVAMLRAWRSPMFVIPLHQPAKKTKRS